MTTAPSLNHLKNMTGLSEAELQRRAEQMVDVKTGKIAALSALDAALVQSSMGQTATMASFTAAGSASLDVHTIEDPAHAFTHSQPFAGFAPEPPPAPAIGGPQGQLEKASRAGGKKITGFCGCHCPPPPPCEPEPPPVFSPEGGANHVATPPPSQDATPPQTAAPAPQTPPAPEVTPRAHITAQMRTGFGLDGAGGAPNGDAPATSSQGPSAADLTGAKSDLDAGSSDMQFEILKMQIQRMSQVQDAMSNTINAMTEEGMTAIRNAKA